MDRVTCFKLCYALGVSMEDLEYSYGIEYRVAFKEHNFVPSSELLQFRGLAMLYNFMLKNYSKFTSKEDLETQIDSWLVGFEDEFGIKPSSLAPCESIIEFIKNIVRSHNNLLRYAYIGLETSLSRKDFIMFCKLPDIDIATAKKISFLMNKTNHIYGLYFYGHELFNVSMGSFLQNDFALRTRLELFHGRQLPRLTDNSYFGERVEKYLNDVYLTDEDILSLDYVYCMTSEYGDICQRFANVVRIDAIASIPDGGVFITRNYSVIPDLAVEFKNLKFAAILPISSKFYYQWKRRKFPNVYLILRGDLNCEKI